MEVKQFLNTLYQKSVKDILVSGYIDSNGMTAFHPMYEKLYFIFPDEKIEMYFGENCKIQFRLIEQITEWFEVDEDDKFAVMSIYVLVFKTEQEVKITSATCGGLALSGLHIEYTNGATKNEVVFDAINFFGFSF